MRENHDPRLLALANGYPTVFTVHDPVDHLGARPSTCAERWAPTGVLAHPHARLETLDRGSCGLEIRAGIELLMDTERRPVKTDPRADSLLGLARLAREVPN